MEEDLLRYISLASLNKEVKDLQVWRSEESRLFSVSSVYDHFKCLWKVKALPNVLIAAWRVLLDRIPLRMALSRRGVSVNTPTCPMCQAKKDSSQHLFLECVYAQRIWSMCFRWIGILFV